jgi:thymidylate synthase (FAD)
MGSDASICEAARCSSGDQIKQKSKDEHLIRYLLRHRHTTPFEHAVLRFRVKVPIFVWRQWIRHRTMSVNEISARYAELPAEWYDPELQDICLQAQGNNQGSSDEVYEGAALVKNELNLQAESAFAYYKGLVEDGVARETARIGLPLSTYTVAVIQINLHNLLHFLQLRTGPHAQFEIREYAHAIVSMLDEHFPATMSAWRDFRLFSMELSAPEQEALSKLLAGDGLSSIEDLFPTKRELKEFKDKWVTLSLRRMLKEARESLGDG